MRVKLLCQDVEGGMMGQSYIITSENRVSSQGLYGVSRRRRPIMITMFSLLAALVVVFSSFVPVFAKSVSNTPIKADAATFSLACGQSMGLNMEGSAKVDWWAWSHSYPVSEKGNRNLTLQDALGEGVNYVNYYGEGKGSEFLVSEKNDESYKTESKTDPSLLESERTFNNCFLGNLGVGISNIFLGAANSVSNIVQYIVLHSFDADLICLDVDNPSGDCLNILKVIGGSAQSSPDQVLKGSGGGIMGSLTRSLYFPLITLAVFATGLWVLYKGIVKRQFRDALYGALWTVLSFIIGLIMLLNPALLTKAPMAVSNGVASCIIGAFSGNNCFSSGGSTSGGSGSSSSENICVSEVVGANPSEQMEVIAGSLTCKTWSAFILNMYANASFGTTFRNLDTKSPDAPTGAILSKAGLNSDDYCVSLHTANSLESQRGGTLSTSGGNKICNLLVYQMYLRVNMSSDGDKPKLNDDNQDLRWYKVVDAAAADEGFWNNWTTSSMWYAFIALVVTVLGSVVLFVTAVFSLVYYISAVILMVFAPIFLLIGVHPGQGKKIMLGWVEKVISNVLKYIASAGFLVVTIAIYGGILEDIDNTGATIMFVIIVTIALLMYRKELVDLIGKVNMGGEQLSSRMAEKLGEKTKKAAKGVGGLAYAGAAGAVGAKMAGGSLRSGFQGATMRQLSRGRGGIANVAQQMTRQNVANRNAMRERERELQHDHDQANDNLDEARRNLNDVDRELGANDIAISDAERRMKAGEQIDGWAGTTMASKNLQDRYASQLEQVNRDPSMGSKERKARRTELLVKMEAAKIADLQHQADVARRRAGTATDPELKARFEARAQSFDQKADAVRKAKFGKNEDAYQHAMTVFASDIAAEKDAMKSARGITGNEAQEIEGLREARAGIEKRREDAAVALRDAERNVDKTKAELDTYSRATSSNLSDPGKIVKAKDVKRTEEDAQWAGAMSQNKQRELVQHEVVRDHVKETIDSNSEREMMREHLQRMSSEPAPTVEPVQDKRSAPGEPAGKPSESDAAQRALRRKQESQGGSQGIPRSRPSRRDRRK